MVSSIVKSSRSASQEVYRTPYRVGNTSATAKGQRIVQMLTGFDMSSGHVTLEDAQTATAAAEYYALQQKLMSHIKKKYGAVMKNIANIEDLRAELQNMALNTDKDIAEIIAKMAVINEKHGLDLTKLKHQAQGEIGVMRAQNTADINVANADFKTRLMMIARGQQTAVNQINKGAQRQIKAQTARQIRSAQQSRQKQAFNQVLTEALNNPQQMPASRARGIFQQLGRSLMGA